MVKDPTNFDEIQWRVCPELQYESARSFQENAKTLLHDDLLHFHDEHITAMGTGPSKAEMVKVQTVESLTRRLENETELNESLMQMAFGKKDVNYGTGNATTSPCHHPAAPPPHRPPPPPPHPPTHPHTHPPHPKGSLFWKTEKEQSTLH